jgi:chloride channel protein, CIC family
LAFIKQEPSPQPNVVAGGFSLEFWLLVAVTGAGSGLCAGLLMKILRLTENFAWPYAAGDFLEKVSHASGEHRVLVLACAGLLTGAVLWALPKVNKKQGGDISTSIWFHSGEFPAVRTTVRALLSEVIVGMGVSLGREEAPRQMGALIASKLGWWRRVTPFQRRFLAACGAGAGMAAVYNVPLGGAIFILEVLLGSVSLSLVLPALACCLIATAVAWPLLPSVAIYVIPSYQLSLPELIWAGFSGPVLGVGAVLYMRAIVWAHKRRPKGWLVLPVALLVCVALGVLSIYYPQLLGNGRNVVQQAFDSQITLPMLGALLLLKPLATAACVGTGAPGGLFTPTMTCGALLGGLLGRVWSLFWPGLDPGSTALIGACAVLAASSQGPISAVVLLLELTHHIDTQVVPLLLAVTGAILVSRRLDSRSIYSGRIYLEETAEPETVISAATPYATVLEHLLWLADKDTALSVIDEQGKVIGEISRDAIEAPRRLGTPFETMTAGDLAVALPRKLPSGGA